MVAIGIDLGTTYSCVAVWKDGTCEIIANDQGNRTTPSYVAFTDEERLIGNAAKNQASQNPENTIFDAKRLIGRLFKDSSTQSDIKHFPYKVIEKETQFQLKEAKFYAGHSLGEYSALCCANSINFEQAINLLLHRGKAMQNAVPNGEGGMLAILGVEFNVINSILDENSIV